MSEITQKRAEELFDSLWSEKGVSKDVLDKDRRLARIFNELLQNGHDTDEIRSEWENLSSEQIFEKYDKRFPVPEQK